MNLIDSIKEFTNKNISVLKVLILFFSFLLICPYFILSFFDKPSCDDYTFALTHFEFGFWGTQAYAFKTWNGRYFTSFLLSADPMVFHSIALYVLIPLTLLTLTIHSIYYFAVTCIGNINKVAGVVLSCFISFLFLDKMPTLVQGIYWAPAAIGYHFANIMTLYLFTNIIKMSINRDHNYKFLKIISGLLVVAICGSNETSMVAVVLLLLSFLFYFLFFEKKLNWFILILFILSILCSYIVISASGNSVRSMSAIDPHKNNIYFTILSSFVSGTDFIYQYILTPQLWVVTLLSILFYFIYGQQFLKDKKRGLVFLLIPIFGFLIICATFSTGFWSIGTVAPERTLNVSFWLFIIFWIVSIFAISNYIVLLFPSIKNLNLRPIIIFPLIGILLVINPSDHLFTAWKDIISGKAYVYNKEWNERINIIKNTGPYTTCEFPSFFMYPTSIFYNDMTDNVKDWDNFAFAKYYNAFAIKVMDREPYFSNKALLRFDKVENKKPENNNIITNEKNFSPPNSCLLNGPETNSSKVNQFVKDINEESPSEIATINFSSQIYSMDSVIDCVLVVYIVDTTNQKKCVFWTGKEINKSNYSKEKWIKENIVIPKSSWPTLDRKDNICAYIWNKGKGRVYVDDLLLTIY
jgi:hypothetical protein